VRTFAWQFRQENHRYPSIQECAKHAGISAEFMRYYLMHQSGCVSLDQTVQGNKRADDDVTIGSFIASDNTDPLDAVEISMLREKLDEWKLGLTDVQHSVITRHYGLDGQEPETLTVIGKELGVSREAIRQHEQRGLRKMRMASVMRRAAA
jgi:hypothetical protein